MEDALVPQQGSASPWRSRDIQGCARVRPRAYLRRGCPPWQSATLVLLLWPLLLSPASCRSMQASHGLGHHHAPLRIASRRLPGGRQYYYLGQVPTGNSDAQRSALEEFKTAADPSGIALASWNATTNPNYCTWTGVVCDPAGMVQVLQLQNKRLNGTLTPSLGLLSNLSVLDLKWNSLNGALPPEVAGIPSLTDVIIHRNNFSGPIPDSLWRPNLQHFLAYSNQLNGPLSGQLSQATSLVQLRLSNNQLQGSIPSELSSLQLLQGLELGANLLQGAIPPTVASLTALSGLDLSANQLTGGIPAEIRGCHSLTSLALQGNNLTGSLPSTLGELAALASLDASRNQLQGPIPDSLAKLTALTTVNLDGNQLSGAIPSSLSSLSKLQSLDLSYNSLNGTIPGSLAQLPTLAALILSNNSLTGGIPPALVQMTGLQQLILGSNPSLGGMLPAWSPKAAGLRALNVSNCNLTGPIPPMLFNISALTRFDFSYNFLNGTVPLQGDELYGPQAVYRMNCLLYAYNISPFDCPFYPRNGMCYLTAQRNLAECLPPVPPGPSGVNVALSAGILAGVVLLWAILLVGAIIAALHRSRMLMPPCTCGGGEQDNLDRMYLEGSDGALLVADTELPGMPPNIKRYTMDEVWTATANFSAYLDPDDLRPAFHGRISRRAKVTVRLMPLPEEHLQQSKQEFVERISAMSRLNCPNILAFRGYAYEDGCFVAVFEPVQQTLFERLHSTNKALSGRPLSWRERMRIALAVADALEFLHTVRTGVGEGEEGTSPMDSAGAGGRRRRGSPTGTFSPQGPFVHGDLKSSNILLVGNNKAKLFDSLVPRNPEEDPLRSVSAHGSFGYLDPNYADTKTLTAASDVYSFGVLLLVLMSGRPAMEDDSATLIVMAQDYFILREDYAKLLDPSLRLRGSPGENGNADGVPREELVAMIELVQTCTQVNEESRPTISWVKEQMMTALRMGPEEYSAPNQPDTPTQGASEIEIEMMSEESAGDRHLY